MIMILLMIILHAHFWIRRKYGDLQEVLLPRIDDDFESSQNLRKGEDVLGNESHLNHELEEDSSNIMMAPKAKIGYQEEHF